MEKEFTTKLRALVVSVSCFVMENNTVLIILTMESRMEAGPILFFFFYFECVTFDVEKKSPREIIVSCVLVLIF